LVGKIDREVAHLVCTIVKAGKIPIIIGGGHNNAYGNIKGTALAKGKSVNAVNLDAHSDFRILEGRHSGNGFSYAYEDGFLKKYFVFGLHECYTSKAVLDLLKKTDDRVRFNTYDEIKVKRQKNFEQELFQALSFVKSDYFGVEIDLDSLPFVPSSAMTNSGFSIEEARQFVYHFGSHANACYLHICEGAPELENTGNPQLLGKLIGYLLTDFIKAGD
jgi:formiminoglutamase